MHVARRKGAHNALRQRGMRASPRVCTKTLRYRRALKNKNHVLEHAVAMPSQDGPGCASSQRCAVGGRTARILKEWTPSFFLPQEPLDPTPTRMVQ